LLSMSFTRAYNLKFVDFPQKSNLEGLVKIFKSYENVQFGEQRVVTVDPEANSSVPVNVAKNLRNLSKATLNGNQVSAQLVANLPNYK